MFSAIWNTLNCGANPCMSGPKKLFSSRSFAMKDNDDDVVTKELCGDCGEHDMFGDVEDAPIDNQNVRSSCGGLRYSSNNEIVDGVPVKAIAWTKYLKDDHGRLRFPEQQEKKLCCSEYRSSDVGICFSGGGNRSSAQSLGFLQILDTLGLLKKVRYISSVSGGSWCNAPFSYLPDEYSMEEFLAPGILGPGNLTEDKLGKAPKGSYLSALIAANPLGPYIGNTVIDDLTCGCRTDKHSGSWNEVVGEAYLGPFGLFKENSVLSAPNGTKGHSHAQRQVAKSKKKVDVIPLRRLNPFSIINCSAVVSAEVKIPLEFTPMYSGLPEITTVDGKVVGGGVVESFAMGAAEPDYFPENQMEVRNGQCLDLTPEKFVSLPFAMGTSSSAAVSAVVSALDTTFVDGFVQNFLGGACLPLWSLADVKNGYKAATVCVDGNATDNSAIVALLRRGVRHIIANLSAGVDILDTEKFFDAISWFPDLFKKEDGNKVFEESKWDELYKVLTDKAKKRQPCVHDQTLTVLTNEKFGVKGGWDVRIIWMYPNRSEAFERACPPSTQALFKEEPVRTFLQKENVNTNFPYVRTDLGNFDAKLLQLLAENTAWQLVEGVGEQTLREFFNTDKTV